MSLRETSVPLRNLTNRTLAGDPDAWVARVMDGEKLMGILMTENLSEFLVLRQMGFQE